MYSPVYSEILCVTINEEKCVRVYALSFQKNMKIIQKLNLMVVMNMLMMMSLGVVAYSGMKNTNDAFDESVELSILSFSKLSSMMEVFVLSMDEARSYHLSGLEDSRISILNTRLHLSH